MSVRYRCVSMAEHMSQNNGCISMVMQAIGSHKRANYIGGVLKKDLNDNTPPTTRCGPEELEFEV